VQALLSLMPPDVRRCFCSQFIGGWIAETESVRDWFAGNSELARLVLGNPGSALAFEILYERTTREPADRYFLECRAGYRVFRRLWALHSHLPELITESPQDERAFLVDNMGSGPGRDMMGVLAEHKGLRERTDVRCIDTDPAALDIGRRMAAELGLSRCVSFDPVSMFAAKPRSADVVLLIGILCPIPLRACPQILRRLRTYCRPGGTLVFSTALTSMVEGDPVSDFIMRILEWHMNYKTVDESVGLAASAGWKLKGVFFDEPLRYHCMVVAQRQDRVAQLSPRGARRHTAAMLPPSLQSPKDSLGCEPTDDPRRQQPFEAAFAGADSVLEHDAGDGGLLEVYPRGIGAGDQPGREI